MDDERERDALNDNELVIAILRKDREALEEFIHLYYDSVYRFLRHLTRSRTDAEDLTQSVFLKAQNRMDSFRGEAGLRTWLHKIAFREFLRWRRTRVVFAPLDALKGAHDRTFEEIEETERLLSALHTLPSALRERFLLFYVQGLSIREVAQVVDTSENAVKVSLSEARRRLRAIYFPSKEVVCYEK